MKKEQAHINVQNCNEIAILADQMEMPPSYKKVISEILIQILLKSRNHCDPRFLMEMKRQIDEIEQKNIQIALLDPTLDVTEFVSE